MCMFGSVYGQHMHPCEPYEGMNKDDRGIRWPWYMLRMTDGAVNTQMSGPSVETEEQRVNKFNQLIK